MDIDVSALSNQIRTRRDELMPHTSSRFQVETPVVEGNIARNPPPPRATDPDEENVHRDIILFLRGILAEAVRRGASDVHFEPKSDATYHIRLRIDGVLHAYLARPYDEYSAVLNTIKVLADLDIAEHGLPLDGHIEFALEETPHGGATPFESDTTAPIDTTEEKAVPIHHVYDVRVSTFPSVNGEVIVMRILNRADALFSMESLGMDIGSLELVRQMLISSFGLILVTGPTGAGKTTTLYALMESLKSHEKNMITIEDPIEFHLDWLRQCEIQESRGFTFERAMSAVLRQDPDVLMVGEIRDAKTAEYAVRSALVGHLVGSTIHANTATGTIARLLDLGIPRSILSHSLNGVLAQRLVRQVCEHCKEEYVPQMFYLSHFGLEDTQAKFYRGRGCELCNQSGYKGRIGLYSVLHITDALRSMIFEQRSLIEIQQFAIEHGMRTLKMDARAKILKGITTCEESARVI